MRISIPGRPREQRGGGDDQVGGRPIVYSDAEGRKVARVDEGGWISFIVFDSNRTLADDSQGKKQVYGWKGIIQHKVNEHLAKVLQTNTIAKL